MVCAEWSGKAVKETMHTTTEQKKKTEAVLSFKLMLTFDSRDTIKSLIDTYYSDRCFADSAPDPSFLVFPEML